MPVYFTHESALPSPAVICPACGQISFVFALPKGACAVCVERAELAKRRPRKDPS